MLVYLAKPHFFKSQESNPDPLHECSRHGPDLYQVNESSGSEKARWGLSRFNMYQAVSPLHFGCCFPVSDIQASYTPG